MNGNGKGDASRPMFVDDSEFGDRFKKTYGTKKRKPKDGYREITPGRRIIKASDL